MIGCAIKALNYLILSGHELPARRVVFLYRVYIALHSSLILCGREQDAHLVVDKLHLHLCYASLYLNAHVLVFFSIRGVEREVIKGVAEL